MQQLSKAKSIINHLYPGVLITIGFVILTPLLLKKHYPPQLSLLFCVIIIALPLLLGHLLWAKHKEEAKNIYALNAYTNKLPTGRLILYVLSLVVFSYIMWGITQPLNKVITDKFLGWLPGWFTTQDFSGYNQEVIKLTLILNLIVNGLIAPFVEELYFRAYLLPRMQVWGKWAFVVNTVLFSLYHFWQPYIYLTLLFSLLPMIYMVWKTKDLRVGILTHCLMNLIGALLSFGLLLK